MIRDRYLARRHDLRLVPAVVAVWMIAAAGGTPRAVVVAVAAVSLLCCGVSIATHLHARGASRRSGRAEEAGPTWTRLRGGWPRVGCGPQGRAVFGASNRWHVAVDVVAFAALAACAALLRLAVTQPGAGRAYADVSTATGWSWDFAAALRTQFAELIGSFPGDGRGLIVGMSVGDTSLVSERLNADMMGASLGHVTAVSGSNCAVAVGLGMGVAVLVGATRNARIWAGLAALLGFVVLVGPQPTVLRAGVMLGLVLVARRAGWAAGGISVLATAVVVLLLVDPVLAKNLGFALSVSATAGIVLLARPLGDALARRLPAWLAQVVALPIAAQLACLPVLVVLGSGISLGSIIANVVVAPVTGVVCVIGLLACLFAGWAAPIAVGLSALAWPATEWVALVARIFAEHPLLRLNWPTGSVGVWSAAGLALLAVVAALWRPGRSWVAAIAVVAAVAVSGVVSGAQIGVDATMPASWHVVACDVGQGDGLVFRSEGSVMVVDVGADGDVLLDCLNRVGVDDVDVLVLTHWDQDHAGGAARVASRIHPGTIVSSTRAPGVGSFDALTATGADVVLVSQGDQIELPGVRAEVLWPPRDFLGDDNDGGVVLAVDAGGVSTLALADTGEEVQNRLVAESPPGRFDVLKVSHHGSANFSRALYTEARVPLALVSVGANNRYRHPRDEPLRALADAGSRVARTDLSGMLVVSLEGGETRLWCERACR